MVLQFNGTHQQLIVHAALKASHDTPCRKVCWGTSWSDAVTSEWECSPSDGCVWDDSIEEFVNATVAHIRTLVARDLEDDSRVGMIVSSQCISDGRRAH